MKNNAALLGLLRAIAGGQGDSGVAEINTKTGETKIHSFDDFIKDMSDSESKKLPSVEQQERALNKHLDLLNTDDEFETGDRVWLTEHGKKRYRFPMDGQVAKVVGVFSAPVVDSEGNITTGEIACVCPSGKIHTYLVDLRLYRKALFD